MRLAILGGFARGKESTMCLVARREYKHGGGGATAAIGGQSGAVGVSRWSVEAGQLASQQMVDGVVVEGCLR